jgi:hypothetical protein
MDIVFEVVSALVGLVALYLLFGRRLQFSGQRLPWYGFRRLPNGDTDVHPELLILLIATVIWVKAK